MRALGLVAIVTFFGALVLLYHEAVGMDYTARQWSGLAVRAAVPAGFIALMVTLAFAIGHTVAALALPTRTPAWSVVAFGVVLTLGFFALVFSGTIIIPGAER